LDEGGVEDLDAGGQIGPLGGAAGRFERQTESPAAPLDDHGLAVLGLVEGAGEMRAQVGDAAVTFHGVQCTYERRARQASRSARAGDMGGGGGVGGESGGFVA